MKISKRTWEKYIKATSKLTDTAVELMKKKIDSLGGLVNATDETIQQLINYAYGLATKYGEGAGTLAAEMYDDGSYAKMLLKEAAKADKGINILDFLIKTAILLEEDDISSVNELESKVSCENLTVEIFAAACSIIAAITFTEVFLNSLYILVNGKIDAETGNDFLIAAVYFSENCAEILTLFSETIAFIEEVCNLYIV